MLCSEHMWSHYMENVSTLARFYTNVCLRIQNRGEIRYPHLGDCDYIKLISLSSVLVVLSRHTFAIQICGICCLPVNFLLPLWYTRVVFCILGDKWDCLFQSTRSYFEYKLYIFMKKSHASWVLTVERLGWVSGGFSTWPRRRSSRRPRSTWNILAHVISYVAITDKYRVEQKKSC